MKRIQTEKVFWVILLLYLLVIAVQVLANTTRFQWDFDIYYHGALTYSQGHDPYLIQAEPSRVPLSANLCYVYPPITLFIFRAFTCLNYELASRIYFGLKIIILIVLLLIWNRYFLKNKSDSLFYLFCLLAFNSALGIDLMAGNISIFEQFLIWIGFYALLKKRFILFGILIVAAALFKIVPILLLSLFLYQKDRNKYLYFLGFAALFTGIMLLTYWADPILFQGFIRNTLTMTDTGVVNPSNLSLIKDVLNAIGKGIGILIPLWLPILIYVSAAAAIAFFSLIALKKVLLCDIIDSEMIALLFSCLVYTLVLPRFKDYSYILLLVPSYYAITKLAKIKPFPILFAILILSSNRFVSLPGLDIIFKAFWAYYPLILAYFIWALYLHYIFTQNKKEPNISSI